MMYWIKCFYKKIVSNLLLHTVVKELVSKLELASKLAVS